MPANAIHSEVRPLKLATTTPTYKAESKSNKIWSVLNQRLRGVTIPSLKKLRCPSFPPV
jgi:hypothetical protein